MSDERMDEDQQFERVLSRLDALMKRNHPVAPEEAEAGEAGLPDAEVEVPLLTEVYRGGVILPVAAGQDAPPTLTEVAGPQPGNAHAPAQTLDGETAMPEGLFSPVPLPELEMDSVVAELLPVLQQMVAKLVQEELFYTQQNLTLRIGQEAERLLRQHLLQGGVRPK